MILPIFIGYLKTNCGIQINAQTRSTGAVWPFRSRERVVTVTEEIISLQQKPAEEWSRVVITTATSKIKQRISLIVLLLHYITNLMLSQRKSVSNCFWGHKLVFGERQWFLFAYSYWQEYVGGNLSLILLNMASSYIAVPSGWARSKQHWFVR